MAERRTPPGEFELIARHFAPLSQNFPGAFGLGDDTARFAVPNGRELVCTTDTLVAGVHFLDEDAEALGGACVAGAQAAGLPGGRRALQQHGAGRVDLGDGGDVHLAGEVRRRRDRHAQALQRGVELCRLGDGPGAAGDQAKGRAFELDAEAGRAGLRREA